MLKQSKTLGYLFCTNKTGESVQTGNVAYLKAENRIRTARDNGGRKRDSNVFVVWIKTAFACLFLGFAIVTNALTLLVTIALL